MDSEHRRLWLERRLRLEDQVRNQQRRSTQDGPRPLSFLHGHESRLQWGARALGLWGRGRRNAGAVRLHDMELTPPGLPAAFDGYRILLLSDLHVAIPSGATEAATRLLDGLTCDLALFGGDYQNHGLPNGAATAAIMAPLLAAVRTRDGMFGVLGNHDRHDVVAPLEALGLRLLLNESVAIHRDGQSLTIAGCDDIHLFHDAAAAEALRGEGFRIALVHSPDFARTAALQGCSLYLAGHTHGGQICLPGGTPVLTALDGDRRRARGVWHQGAMLGYTGTGLGSGAMPVRFNCPPEVARITLRCAP